jgi:hypothetical protein
MPSPGLGPARHSVLLVEVAGDLRLMPAQFYVTVDVTKRPPAKAFTIPPTPTAISLPASFSIELDRSVIGPVVVDVQAFDANTMWIAEGRTRQDHIKVGDDTIVVVTLKPPDGFDPDGGSPDDGGDPDAGDPDAGDPDAGDPDGGVVDAGDSDAVPTDAEDQ